MEEIDAIRINLDSSKLTLLNVCLAFIMFGVALDLSISDFKRIVKFPRSVIIGLSSQLIVLPIVTLYLIYFWQPIPSMALGLIMVACCPGGNISNFAVHFGKGNTALSVTMTSVVTLAAIINTPLLFSLCASAIPEVKILLSTISVNAWDMIKVIIFLILIPLVLGISFHHRWPKLTLKIRTPIRRLSLLFFVAFIVFALIANKDHIVKYLHLVLALVIVHNLLALAVGYYWAKSHGLPYKDCKAISIETGIQNAGLGLVLIFNFFNHLGGMMIIAAFWGVWDLLSGLLLSLYWNFKD